MIENIKEKQEEIKKIWLKYRDKLKVKKIFSQYLGDYFDVSHCFPKIPLKDQLKDSDWLFFVHWVRDWKRAEKKEGRRGEARRMTDEEAEELQNLNRKKAIILLRDVLTKYEENPNFFKNLTPKDVTLIYRTIQNTEEIIKRTKIAKSKLGLEAVKSFFLPYQRMSAEELKLLKKNLDASFERFLQLKSGTPTE